jgi:ATP/maltotriose-dependent transcriptional regulator MalT
VGQAGQPISVRPPERRIIQRRRLLTQLEETNARTILLIAPAGYGKTTLARQWLAQEGGSWLNTGAATRDIPVLARGLARALSEITEIAAQHVEEAIRASTSPARQAQAVVSAILDQIKSPLEQWLVIDDYHLLSEEPEAEALIQSVEESGMLRLLLASRTRPRWATARRFIYQDIVELGQAELALDASETAAVLSEAPNATALGEQAHGWPAVIGLAAVANTSGAPPANVSLYDFFADELYERASLATQDVLLRLSLLPGLRRVAVEEKFGSLALTQATATGLVHETAAVLEVHPLVRAFLHTKVHERDAEFTRAAVSFAFTTRQWDHAFSLIQEFSLTDELAHLIIESFPDMIEAGRVTTLERFARFATNHGGVDQSVLDLIDAEVALRDGQSERASELAEAAASRFSNDHPLAARSRLVAGSGAHHDWRLEEAYTLFGEAMRLASRSRDINDAAWKRCLVALFLEDGRLRHAVEEFETIVDGRAEDRLHLLMARQYLARLTDGLYDLRADAAAAADLLPMISDPMVRTGWGSIYGYSLTLQGRYGDAKTTLATALVDIDRFDLQFGRPHIQWTMAAAELGLRNFRRADALLVKVERLARENGDPHQHLNTRVLRARLLLAQHRVPEAVAITTESFTSFPTRGMYGEYLAMRGLALAVAGDHGGATVAVGEASALTGGVETRVICAAAQAICCLGLSTEDAATRNLLMVASSLKTWDGVVCAVRASVGLLHSLVRIVDHRESLTELLLRSNDAGLARTAGLIDRQSYGRQGLLSRRESEVIDLLQQGMKNREIAATLYISEATVKVHVRHILEKLGARTRAAAVGRYAELEASNAADEVAVDSKFER